MEPDKSMHKEYIADLEPSFIETLTSSPLSEILQDFSEVALDSQILDSFAKEIPIISTIVGLRKAAISVRDYFLLRKVIVFLKDLDGTSPEEREAFIRRVEAESKFQQRVGETIIVLLDRYDHLDKASLMAKVLCGCIQGVITYEEFVRISTAIDRPFIGDLFAMLDYFATEKIDRELKNRRDRTARNVYASNLSHVYVLTEEQAKEGGHEFPQVYHFNQYANKFAEVVLGDEFQGGRW